MSAATSRATAQNPGQQPERISDGDAERPVLVAEPPSIRGPFPVEDNPVVVEYEVVARLALPEPDAEAVPTVSFTESPDQGEYLDLQWTTTDDREPRGVWERAVVIELPRQFVVGKYELTGEPELLEREAGA